MHTVGSCAVYSGSVQEYYGLILGQGQAVWTLVPPYFPCTPWYSSVLVPAALPTLCKTGTLSADCMIIMVILGLFDSTFISYFILVTYLF